MSILDHAAAVEAMALVVDGQIDIDGITDDETCMRNLYDEARWQGHVCVRVAKVRIEEVTEQ